MLRQTGCRTDRVVSPSSKGTCILWIPRHYNDPLGERIKSYEDCSRCYEWHKRRGQCWGQLRKQRWGQRRGQRRRRRRRRRRRCRGCQSRHQSPWNYHGLYIRDRVPSRRFVDPSCRFQRTGLGARRDPRLWIHISVHWTRIRHLHRNGPDIQGASLFLLSLIMELVVSLIFRQLNFYHPIIGIVVVSLLAFQPVIGLLHHRLYKTSSNPTGWSTLHVWLGRLVITLGIINGGLGLRFAADTTNGEIVYGVFAGLVWLVWVGVSLWKTVGKKAHGN